MDNYAVQSKGSHLKQTTIRNRPQSDHSNKNWREKLEPDGVFSPKTIAKLSIPAVSCGFKDLKRTVMVDLIKKWTCWIKKCLDHREWKGEIYHSEATRSSSGIIGHIQRLKEWRGRAFRQLSDPIKRKKNMLEKTEKIKNNIFQSAGTFSNNSS